MPWGCPLPSPHPLRLPSLTPSPPAQPTQKLPLRSLLSSHSPRQEALGPRMDRTAQAQTPATSCLCNLTLALRARPPSSGNRRSQAPPLVQTQNVGHGHGRGTLESAVHPERGQHVSVGLSTEGGRAWGQRCVGRELSVLSLQFSSEPKPAQKAKVCLKGGGGNFPLRLW